MNKKHWGLISFLFLSGVALLIYSVKKNEGADRNKNSDSEATSKIDYDHFDFKPSKKFIDSNSKRLAVKDTSHKKKFKNIENYIEWFEQDSPYQEIKNLKKHVPEIYQCENKVEELREEINFYQHEDEDRPATRDELLLKVKKYKEKYGNCTIGAKGVLSAINTFFYDNENEKALYLIFKKYKVGEYFEFYEELDRGDYQSRLFILRDVFESLPELTSEQLKKEKFVKEIFSEAGLPSFFVNLSRLSYLVDSFTYLVEYGIIDKRFESELEFFTNRVNELRALNINATNYKDLVSRIKETRELDSELKKLIQRMKRDTYPSN